MRVVAICTRRAAGRNKTSPDAGTNKQGTRSAVYCEVIYIKLFMKAIASDPATHTDKLCHHTRWAAMIAPARSKKLF